MKLFHWPRTRTSLFGATRNEFLAQNIMTASQLGASQKNLCGEDFISRLLDRRWALEKHETKIHEIMFSTKRTMKRSDMFGNLSFSIYLNPKSGETVVEERSNDSSFYIVRDDLLHPLVNGNKARKLDALLPMIEDCSGTDVSCAEGLHFGEFFCAAVACAERGLRSHLLLRGEEPEVLTGYNLISSMYGDVIYVPRSLYAKREEMLIKHANAVAGPSGSVLWFTDVLDTVTSLSDGWSSMQRKVNRSLEDGAKKVVIVKEGAGDAVALLGIIRLVSYLSQSHVLGKERAYNFVIDAGTGTTAVGFALGALLLGLPWKVTAVMLADKIDGYKTHENRLISEFNKHNRFDSNYPPLIKNELVNWVDRGTPRKFGNILDGEIKACQQVAHQTGVLVDPIYTLAGWELAVHLSQKESQDNAKVLMIHTGGTLGMFGLAQRYKSSFSRLKDGPTH